MAVADARPGRSATSQVRGPLATLGPAFVAAIAYVDPSNFATNVLAGAKFGYALVRVVIVASLMAMLVQSLSAKLGLRPVATRPSCAASAFPAG